jgi:hypothetical protein
MSRSSSFHVRVGPPLSRTWRYCIPFRRDQPRRRFGDRNEPIDDPTSTATGIWAVPEMGPDVVDGTVLSIEALPAGIDTSVPEETVERALVFAARELQQVFRQDIVILVDGLDDA